jgi:hypothetical protein
MEYITENLEILAQEVPKKPAKYVLPLFQNECRFSQKKIVSK